MKFTKIKIDTKDIEKEFVQFALDELNETNRRTAALLQQGKDVEGGAMQSYSPSYKKQISSGKVRGKTNPNLTNLTQTGELQGSRVVTRVKDGAELSIDGGRNLKIASYVFQKGFDGWFEFGKKDLDRIQKNLALKFDKLLQKVIKVSN